jgi:hypothetical protein
MKRPLFGSTTTATLVAGLVATAVVLTGATLASQLFIAAKAPSAPVIKTGPANPTSATVATFTFTDSTANVTFQCSLDSAQFSRCISGQTYGGLANGSHTFRVEAQAGSGLLSVPATRAWTVDTIPPALPVITSGPGAISTANSATFHFTDSTAKVTFQCALDGGAFSACTNGSAYSGLAVGGHTFQVRAVSAAGVVGSAASYTWTIAASAGGFPISGSITQALYPGISPVLLSLVLTNPNNFGIQITSVKVTVSGATTKPSCDGRANLLVTRVFAAGPVAVVVPKNSTRSLQDLGIPQAQWPQVQMPNLSTNQDACKGATFTLTYTGTATKANP